MPRKLLKRYLPDPVQVKNRRELRRFRWLFEDPSLLHLNRHSVAGGLALALFIAFIPMPGQMLASAMLAVALRVNLVIAVLGVWVTNPITMPPIFYFCYRVGARILDTPVRGGRFEPTLEWFWREFDAIWPPLLLGGVLLGLAAAAAGYITVHLIWRLHIVRAWQQRRARRNART